MGAQSEKVEVPVRYVPFAPQDRARWTSVHRNYVDLASSAAAEAAINPNIQIRARELVRRALAIANHLENFKRVPQGDGTEAISQRDMQFIDEYDRGFYDLRLVLVGLKETPNEMMGETFDKAMAGSVHPFNVGIFGGLEETFSNWVPYICIAVIVAVVLLLLYYNGYLLQMKSEPYYGHAFLTEKYGSEPYYGKAYLGRENYYGHSYITKK